MSLFSDLMRPYPGEDEISFAKRKAYFIRFSGACLSYGKRYIENKQNKRVPLSSLEKAEIDAFWSRYMTPKQRDLLIDYRFYEAYKSVLRENEHLCEYIPDTFYSAFIDDYYENPQHSKSSDDKNLYDLYFHDINRPKTIFRKIYDLFLDESYKEISLETAIAMAREQGEVILKICRFSGSGRGIQFWNASTDDESIIRDFLQTPKDKDIVCQAIIKQHKELARINATSVNTIRIMTLLLHGKVHVLSSIMRMGVNGSRVDNCYSGGVFSGIRPNGQLKEVAYDENANLYMTHPQGIAFESVMVPNYNECLNISISLARRFCGVSRLISWDFAIGEDAQPILIEFNLAYGGLDVHQLPNGPIFGDLTEEVLDDVFENAYTLNSILKSMQ